METPASRRRRVILETLLALPVLTGPLVLVAGCSKKPQVKAEAKEMQAPPAPPPPKVSIQLRAAQGANRGPSGIGLPVVVRVYTLKSLGSFNTADFYSLYDHDSQVLGADLLARDEFTLAPGQSVPLERELSASAAYLGVVAAFRDIDNSRWRATLPLEVGADNRVLIEVGPKAVSIRQV